MLLPVGGQGPPAPVCVPEKTPYAQTLLRSASVANDFTAYRPSGMKVRMPFIQSVYCCSVRTSANGSACAANVAPGLQYTLHPSQPFPVSQASKNFAAVSVIVIGPTPSRLDLHGSLVAVPHAIALRLRSLDGEF